MGRPLDNDFQPEHRLYYRIEHDDEMEGEYLDPQKIRAAFDLSVNWSKYSKPWDVLFGMPAWGIASVLVKDISVDLPVDLSSQQREGRKPHLYRPVHDPYDDNYSHSVIAVFKDNDRRVKKSSEISVTAKREFRQLLSDKSEILLRPSIKT